MKRWIGNTLALVMGLISAAVTIYFSKRFLKEPQTDFSLTNLVTDLDWLTLAASGLVTGLIGFFVTWGHFQSDPVPPKVEGAVKEG